jgi:hypothetical protein
MTWIDVNNNNLAYKYIKYNNDEKKCIYKK